MTDHRRMGAPTAVLFMAFVLLAIDAVVRLGYSFVAASFAPLLWRAVIVAIALGVYRRILWTAYMLLAAVTAEFLYQTAVSISQGVAHHSFIVGWHGEWFMSAILLPLAIDALRVVHKEPLQVAPADPQSTESSK